MSTQLADLPLGVVIVMIIAGVAQVTLDIVALVDLYRRPVERVTAGNKWVWAAVILLVNLLGAILYLAVGRKPAPAVEAPLPSAPTVSRSEGVADALYGRRTDAAGGPDAPSVR